MKKTYFIILNIVLAIALIVVFSSFIYTYDYYKLGKISLIKDNEDSVKGEDYYTVSLGDIVLNNEVKINIIRNKDSIIEYKVSNLASDIKIGSIIDEFTPLDVLSNVKSICSARIIDINHDGIYYVIKADNLSNYIGIISVSKNDTKLVNYFLANNTIVYNNKTSYKIETYIYDNNYYTFTGVLDKFIMPIINGNALKIVITNKVYNNVPLLDHLCVKERMSYNKIKLTQVIDGNETDIIVEALDYVDSKIVLDEKFINAKFKKFNYIISR